MTPLETAAAYATIANDGVYIEPTFYTKVETSAGKTVFETKQKSREVFSKETAYIVKDLLKQPVEGTYGTATYCKISGIDVAAKTGTTNENYDRWLCGFTPYYTASCWYGYDIGETVNYYGKNPAGLLWANVMKSVHSSLGSASFEKPSDVQTYTICAETGMLANGYCSNTYSENFLKGTVPKTCTEHNSSNTGSNSLNSDRVQNKIQIEQDVVIDEPVTNVEENTDTSPETVPDTNTGTETNTTTEENSGNNTSTTTPDTDDTTTDDNSSEDNQSTDSPPEEEDDGSTTETDQPEQN